MSTVTTPAGMQIKNIDDLLQTFVYKDEDRPKFMKTWSKKFDCPCCDGTGYTSTSELKPTGNHIVDPNELVWVERYDFKATYLNMLLGAMKFLKCEQATVMFGQPYRGALFSLSNNIDILIMSTSTFRGDIVCKLDLINHQP